MRRYLVLITFVFLTLGLILNPGVAMAQFDVGAVSQTVSDKISWHGYYEFEYWDKDDKNATFDAHKIVVWMGVKINEKVFLSSELEYEHFPRLGKDSRDGGAGEVKVDSAQLRITPMDNLAVYMGVFYVPFGIEYHSYPGWKNKMVTRPKVMKSGGVIPGTWSDVGLGAYYEIEGIGDIDLYVLNGDAKNGGISRDSSGGGNDAKSFGARFMLNEMFEGINLGASYVSGEWDDNGNSSVRYGAHLNVDTGKIIQNAFAPAIIFEYVSGGDDGASSVEGKDKNVSGYYLQASVNVLPSVEIAARFGEYDSDEEKSDNGKTETSIGIVWHALEHFQIKGEYQVNSEEGTEKDNDLMVIQVVAHW